MRGGGKSVTRAAYRGYAARMQTFSDVWDEDDPMAMKNHTVRRAHIKTEVLCAVFQQDSVRHFENRMDFNSAEYALQAHKKFGPCRVVFYQANEGQIWREIRWKNQNMGTLYKRPSFINLKAADVPEQLQLAAMLL